jgi:hypothetical protein
VTSQSLPFLTPGELRFTALAWLAAPAVELGLALLGVRRVRAGLDRWIPVGGLPTGTAVAIVAGERAVGRAYRLHPLLSGQCLPRSLLQYALHRAEGADVTLVIGVKPPRGATLEAHAWVEEVGAPREHPDFSPLHAVRPPGHPRSEPRAT